jgi:peptidoglycan/LPS O-acetylase OafA/YrhL
MPEVEEGQFYTEGSVHLDAVRGLAALVVVLGHTRSLYFTSIAAPPASVISGTVADVARSKDAVATSLSSVAAPRVKITIGNEAVMIFFVLSGFLVGGSVLRSLRKNTWSWSDYLTKRLTRLWVVLVPALLAGFVIDRAGIALFGPQSIYGSPAGQVIVVGNLASRLNVSTLLGNLFFTQGILVQDFGVNESLWSLTFEFWYYILFPLLAIALLGRLKVSGRVVSILCLAAISYFVGPWIMMHFPIWMLGAAVALLPVRLPERAARILAAVVAVALILSMGLLRAAPVSIYVAEWGMAVGSGCLIYLIKQLKSKRRPDWYSAVAGFFSRISYTLYLVHLPLAVFVCAMVNRPWHIWARTGGNLAIWMVTNVVVIAITCGFYRLFEANTWDGRRSGSGSQRRRLPKVSKALPVKDCSG